MTCEDIRKSLKSSFDIKISKKDLLEMLNDMQAAGKIRRIKKGALMENQWTL
jgi:restriction endonuclease